MNFTESVQTCYKKFFDFSGRASKSEYWWFQLFQIIIYILAFIFVIRIHDSNKSGWFVLLSFIPIIGLFVFILLIQDGSKGKNRFGAKPKK